MISVEFDLIFSNIIIITHILIYIIVIVITIFLR